MKKDQVPKVFILDVDGVLTSGDFFYTESGKVMKSFGPDDHDALSLLRPLIEVRFVTGDKKGFGISRKRIVDDMDFKLDLVSTVNRTDWIREYYPLDKVIYMGDGIFDYFVMKEVAYSIAPAQSDRLAIEHADYVTKRRGGDRAVAEAALHILELFFEVTDRERASRNKVKLSGEWTV